MSKTSLGISSYILLIRFMPLDTITLHLNSGIARLAVTLIPRERDRY